MSHPSVVVPFSRAPNRSAESLLQQMQREEVTPTQHLHGADPVVLPGERSRARSRILQRIFSVFTANAPSVEFCPTPFVTLIRAVDMGDPASAFGSLDDDRMRLTRPAFTRPSSTCATPTNGPTSRWKSTVSSARAACTAPHHVRRQAATLDELLQFSCTLTCLADKGDLVAAKRGSRVHMMSASHRVLHYQLCPVSKPRLSSHPSLPPAALSLSLSSPHSFPSPRLPQPRPTSSFCSAPSASGYFARAMPSARAFSTPLLTRETLSLPLRCCRPSLATHNPARRREAERGATVGISRAHVALQCALEATQPGGRPDRLISAFAHLIHQAMAAHRRQACTSLSRCVRGGRPAALLAAPMHSSTARAGCDAGCLCRARHHGAHDLLAPADHVEAAVEAKTSAASEAVTNATDVTEETEPMGAAPNQSAGRRGRATRDSSHVWLPDPSLVDSLLRSAERLVSTHEGLRLALHRLGAPLPSGMSPVSVVSPKFAPWLLRLPPVVREEVAPGVAAEEKDGAETAARRKKPPLRRQAGRRRWQRLHRHLREDTGAGRARVHQCTLERRGSLPLNPTPRGGGEHDSGGDGDDDDEGTASSPACDASLQPPRFVCGSLLRRDPTLPRPRQHRAGRPTVLHLHHEVTAAAIKLTPAAERAIACVIGAHQRRLRPVAPHVAGSAKDGPRRTEEEEGPELETPSGLWWSEADDVLVESAWRSVALWPAVGV